MIIGLQLEPENLSGGVVNPHTGEILAKETLLTEPERGPDAVVANLIRLVQIFQDRFSVEKVGISVPGILDAERQKILAIPSIGELKGLELANLVSKEVDLPVNLENKAVCALLAERWLGAARKYLNVVVLVLGTDIWGAILLDGHLYRGKTGRAGNIGQQIIDLAIERKNGYGTFVGLASGRGIQKLTKMSVFELLEKAKTHDLAAQKMLEELAEKICVGIYNVWCVLDPEVVILAGEITNYFGQFRRFFLDLPVKVIKSELGEEVFILGAAKATALR